MEIMRPRYLRFVPRATQQVYLSATIVRHACDLRHKIAEAIDSVIFDMLGNTWIKIQYIKNILRATNGAHIKKHA